MFLPAAIADSLAITLSPILWMASGVGPTNWMPASITACAKSERSDRKP